MKSARAGPSRWRSTPISPKTGTSDPVELRGSLDELAQEFDFAKIGRAPAHFDPKELDGLNAKLLHGLSYDAVAARLRAMGIEGRAKVLGRGEAEPHASVRCRRSCDAHYRACDAGD
ncbi:MAG: hypothetical protein WDM89_17485 [Rhizomicrobium sp.]